MSRTVIQGGQAGQTGPAAPPPPRSANAVMEGLPRCPASFDLSRGGGAVPVDIQVGAAMAPHVEPRPYTCHPVHDLAIHLEIVAATIASKPLTQQLE